MLCAKLSCSFRLDKILRPLSQLSPGIQRLLFYGSALLRDHNILPGLLFYFSKYKCIDWILIFFLYFLAGAVGHLCFLIVIYAFMSTQILPPNHHWPPLKYQGYNLPFLETTLNPHIWSFLTVGRTSPAHPQDLLSPAAGCLSRCPALHSCSVLPALYFCFLTHLDLLGKKPNLIQCGEGKGVVGKERENHSKSRLLFLLVELADFQCSGDSVKESKW